jgi:flagellar biosynthetic protein FliR
VQLELPIYPITTMLVMVRFSALVGMTAVFGRTMVPVRIRLALALALTWFAVGRLPPEWAQHCESLSGILPLVIALCGEILLGAAMGLICDLFFAILNVMGDIVGQESSLAMAQMIDPSSGIEESIISTIFSILFTLLVLLWDGHLFFIKLIMESFHTLPPGFCWFRQELLEMYVTVGGDLFEWGVRFALPVIAGGMIVGIAMGLMAKMAPEFNVLMLALPIRLYMGISILAVFILNGIDPLYKVFETMLMHMKFLIAGGV